MDSNNVVTKEIINWSFFNQEVPILDLCDVLGIEVHPNFWISCPNPHHADEDPSCKIYPENNSYHCFACGENGSPINLVLAVKFGVSKEDLVNLRRENRKAAADLMKKAVYFIDGYFKGGIRREQMERKGNELEVPYIPKQILNSVGLSVNPILIGQNIKVDVGYISGKPLNKQVLINTDEYFTTKTEKAEFLLDKLLKKQTQIEEEPDKIIRAYPLLDDAARQVLVDTAVRRSLIFDQYIEEVRDYYFKQSERDFPSDITLEEDELSEER